MHLQGLEAVGLVVGSLELSEDGKAPDGGNAGVQLG